MTHSFRRRALALIATAGLVLPALVISMTARPASASTFSIGQVFASVSNGSVKVYDPSTTGLLQTLSDTLGGFTTGGVFDASNNFYVTNFTHGVIDKYDSSGTLQPSFATGLNFPESLVFDGSGNLYAGQAGTNTIAEFNSGGTRLSNIGPVTTENRGTDWIDLASDQCTLYYTSEGTHVLRYNKCTAAQLSNFNTSAFSGTAAYALRIRPNGELLVADSSQVIRLDSSGNVIQTYQCSGLTGCGGNLFALNLDPDGTSYWTGDFTSGDIWRVDIATGNVLQTIATGCGTNCLFGLTINGQITVASNPITVNATPITATEGTPFSGNVGTFTEVNDSTYTSSQYTATIDWGDGSTPTTGSVTGNTGGPFTVSGGPHTYTDENGYTMKVSVTDTTTSNKGSGTAAATVSDAALSSAACATPSLSALAFNSNVANFTDGNSGATPSDFTATINWGDGSTPTTGSVSGSSGSFTVSGTHNYVNNNMFTTYAISVSVLDDGGSTTSTPTAGCSVVVGNGAFVISDKADTSGGVVNFWGSQWSKNNPFNNGTKAPSGFKGFSIYPTAPSCGSNFSFESATGNSPPPPLGPLPSSIPVIVTSEVTQSGSLIIGHIAHIVMVSPKPGYNPAVGHDGNGTVTTTVC